MEPSIKDVSKKPFHNSPTLLEFVVMIEHVEDIKSQLRFGVSKTDLVTAYSPSFKRS